MKAAIGIFLFLGVIGIYRIMQIEEEPTNYIPCDEDFRACVQAP